MLENGGGRFSMKMGGGAIFKHQGSVTMYSDEIQSDTHGDAAPAADA